MSVYVGDCRYSLAKALELITSAFSHQLSISHTPYKLLRLAALQPQFGSAGNYYVCINLMIPQITNSTIC